MQHWWFQCTLLHLKVQRAFVPCRVDADASPSSSCSLGQYRTCHLLLCVTPTAARRGLTPNPLCFRLNPGAEHLDGIWKEIPLSWELHLTQWHGHIKPAPPGTMFTHTGFHARKHKAFPWLFPLQAMQTPSPGSFTSPFPPCAPAPARHRQG